MLAMVARSKSMSLSRPEVSVVIVSYNDEHLLRRLFDSLERQRFVKFEVLVVDNASNPTVRALSDIEGARYFRNRNTGYTGGNNLGVTYAHGDLILILNSDTWLESEAIMSLVNFFQTVEEGCMVLAPKIMIRDTDLINSVGMIRFHRRANLYSNIGYLERDIGQYDEPREIQAFDGAAFMFRKRLMDETYLFNPAFFAGSDSTDLAERVKKLGYSVWTCPQAVVHHELHATYRDSPLNVRPRLVRNSLAHTLTNLGMGSLIITCLTLLHFCIVRVRRRDFFTAKHYLTGLMQFVRDFGTLVCSARSMAENVKSSSHRRS